MSSELALPSNTKRNWHDYRRTVVGYTSKLWSSLNRRTINGSRPRWDRPNIRYYLNAGIRLEMTRDELVEYIRDNWATITAIWNAGQTPSIDRIDGNGPYSSNNIRFIPLRDNCVKAAHETNVKRRFKKLMTQIAY